MRVPKTFKKAISEQEDALFTYPASCNKESLTLRRFHFLFEDGSNKIFSDKSDARADS